MGFIDTMGKIGVAASPFLGPAAAIAGGALQYFGQKSTNATNVNLANTSWQRGVNDIKAAGLNPALAYQQGGAPSPTTQNAAADAGTSAASAASTYNDIATGKAQRVAALAQADKAEAEARTTDAIRDAVIENTNAGAALSRTNAANIQAMSPLNQALAVSQRRNLDNQADRTRQEFNFTAEAWATKMAQLKADLNLTQTQARQSTANAILNELQQPHAANAANAEKSVWKRKFAPYLNDAGAILRGGSHLNSILNP